MEAAAGVAVARGGVSLPMTSSNHSLKEWRVVTDHPVRNTSNEDLERTKLGHSDERLIYEVQQGREPADVDFCSITMDGSSGNDILQQRLHSVVKQREELQHMEIELRTQLIARSEVMEMQNTFDSQITEQLNANVKLQEQLLEREQAIHELERKMEEKERELHAIRLDSEAAWAKEDLLREQSKELATFRREHENAEAERTQHLKQIHDVQERFQEKERQFMELQEQSVDAAMPDGDFVFQHRVAQETVLFKDREAQAWMTRAQEMDALQSSNYHNMQAELRERTEHFNQLYHYWQQQFVEMERAHVHMIQQLQLDLAEARERNGTYSDESHTSQTNSRDASHFGQSKGSQLEMNGNGMHSGNSGGLSNGNPERVSSGDASAQADHAPGLTIAPQSLLGMPTYIPGQMNMHPFVINQLGVPQSVPSHVPQSHFHSLPVNSSLQHWQNQQAVSDGSEMPIQNPSQTEQSLLRSDTNYDYEASMNGQAYLDVHISQGLEPHTLIPSSNEEGQVLESVDKSYTVVPQSQQSLQQMSSIFHDALRLDPPEQNSETEEKSVNTSASHGIEVHGLMVEPSSSAANTSESPIHPTNFSEMTMSNATIAVPPEAYVSAGLKNALLVGKTAEVALLDERSLLACIVRTIPPGSGGRIRISSTLPNRLGKMLAPLHWHDYKKKYGKLDDFLASHPELREGAQEIIAATAAVAKVAAAAAATASHSSLLPSVAVTPMAQSSRVKKALLMESKSAKADKNNFKEYAASKPGNTTDNPSKLSAVQNQHSNGVLFNVGGGIPTVKIVSKPKDHVLNGSETRPAQSSIPLNAANGANLERSDSSFSKGSTQGRPGGTRRLSSTLFAKDSCIFFDKLID
ncbi:hypothetical protein RJ639_001779 [Escallonia herrerae]|uniref:DUF7725 domain-containing protein n=1 Tax=Escallonia herrerae TaxID=1293975 RepID=A0AA89BMG9_9ASTE|nr:hypothetical protein RJ639_001779 [Escallonia herrerae]